MKILLIGNFAPPFEEENLHNITLFNRLVEEGHQCTVINIAGAPSANRMFINASSITGYFFKLLRHGYDKDVIHFLTKGYLRVGLLKLMLSILAGTLFRAKRILTIHAEFFSVLGQMRSPFGGTQTLNTSFYLADRILFTDQDTCDVARMYMRRPNFAMVPSFIYLPEEIDSFDTIKTAGMKAVKNIVFLANVKYPSFLFEMLSELVSSRALPDDTGIAIAISDKPSLSLQRAIEDSGGPLKDRLFFVEYDDIQSALKIFSRAHIVLRPMSCDGSTFFKSFAMCAKKALRSGRYIYFPHGLVFVKEGAAAKPCAEMINTMIAQENAGQEEYAVEDPFEQILSIYKE